jgi:hypothetical protein
MLFMSPRWQLLHINLTSLPSLDRLKINGPDFSFRGAATG